MGVVGVCDRLKTRYVYSCDRLKEYLPTEQPRHNDN